MRGISRPCSLLPGRAALSPAQDAIDLQGDGARRGRISRDRLRRRNQPHQSLDRRLPRHRRSLALGVGELSRATRDLSAAVFASRPRFAQSATDQHRAQSRPHHGAEVASRSLARSDPQADQERRPDGRVRGGVRRRLSLGSSTSSSAPPPRPTKTSRHGPIGRRGQCLAHEIARATRHHRFLISSHIPKPHTPFQWEEMNSREELIGKQRYLKSLNRSSQIALVHDVDISYLEAVFSRGDPPPRHYVAQGARSRCVWTRGRSASTFASGKTCSAAGVDPDWYALRAR